MVNKDVIDDASRYDPQPTIRSSLFLKVIKEKMLLIKPIRNIIMVILAATCIKTDCFPKDIFN